MSKWKMVKLSDAFELQMGKTPSRDNLNYWTDGRNKWVSIADIGKAGKYIYKTKECITDKAVSESGIKVVPAKTVVMSFKLSLGKTCITEEAIYTNEAIMAFIDKGNFEIDNDYIYHLFKGKDWSEGTNKAVMGATLNKATLSLVKIPLPPLEVQRKIAETLDAASELLAMRKNQLAELDKLIQSVFYDMFGDPVKNSLGWEEINISKILGGKVTNGFFAKRDEYVENGNVTVLGVANVVNRMYSKHQDLPRTNANESDIRKYSIQYGDLLFCRSSLVAEGIGKASIVSNNVPANTLFECHVIRLPINLEICVPEYIQVLTTTDYFRYQILSQSKTATMTTIGQDGILKANILLPPMCLQNQYRHIIEKIEEQKALVQTAIDETQTLFNSLMNEYFE